MKKSSILVTKRSVALVLILFLLLWDVGAQTTNLVSGNLVALEKQYRQAKERGDSNTISEAAYLAGEAHLKVKNHKRSIDYLLIAKDLYKTANNTIGLANTSCRLAQNYYRTGNTKRYKDYVALAQKLIGQDTLSASYLLLLDTQIDYFKSAKKYPQAKYLIDRKTKLSVLAEPEKLPVPKTPVRTATPVVKKPVPQITATVPAIIRKEKSINEVVLAVAIGLAALLAGGLIYYFYKDRRRKLNQRMLVKDMQSQLLKNIAHSIESVGGSPTLAHQLNHLSQIKAGTKKLNFHMEPIGSLLQSVSAPFLQQAAQKEIAVISNIEISSVEKLVDRDALQLIVNLLWTEALLHTPPKNSLYYSATLDKDDLDVRISYPCDGLSKEQLPHLFESFYQSSAENFPNPVGFALLQSLVNWYHGQIEATLEADVLRIVTRLPLNATPKEPKFTPGLVL